MTMPPVHPIADIWPLMSEVDLGKLAADIAAYGQRLPITQVDGEIIDGRNRWLACEQAGVEPWVEDVETDDIEALAWSLNEHRRHANEGVRAMAAARYANMRQGARTDLGSIDTKSLQQAAVRLHYRGFTNCAAACVAHRVRRRARSYCDTALILATTEILQ
jgi:ParB-like chromosome segregation protein Spo0J